MFPCPSTHNRILTWRKGRTLAFIGDTSFIYDGEGQRISKTTNGVTTEYISRNKLVNLLLEALLTSSKSWIDPAMIHQCKSGSAQHHRSVWIFSAAKSEKQLPQNARTYVRQKDSSLRSE